MRHIAWILGGLLLLGSTSYLYLAGDPVEATDLIPEDTVAILVLNRIPSSLAFLEKTRIREWIDMDSIIAESSIEEQVNDQALAELRACVTKVWICFHGLSRKTTGTLRLELSVIAEPRWFMGGQLRDLVRSRIAGIFGEGTQRVAEGDLETIRGIGEGQVLFISSRGKYLIFSNSQDGLRAIGLTANHYAPSVSASRSFRQVEASLARRSDLYLYWAGWGASGLPDSFGYGVLIDGDQVFDSYLEPD